MDHLKEISEDCISKRVIDQAILFEKQDNQIMKNLWIGICRKYFKCLLIQFVGHITLLWVTVYITTSNM